MTSVPVDPGIVGPSYQAAVTLQDAENAINWFIEVAEVEGAKATIALLGTPGLLPLVSTQVGETRCLWPLPGGQQAIAVVGTGVYIVNVTAAANQTTIAQLVATQVGTMLTDAGPVCIRDNGVISNGRGGFAFIVDGVSWYYYALAGMTTTMQFSASLISGSATVTLPGVLPAGLIISPGAVLSGTGIPGGTVIASIDYNTPAIEMSAAASATTGTETITLTIAPFGQITDPGVVPASRLAFIEGFILANQIGTRTFIQSGPTAYSQTFPPSFFALKDSSTDNLVTLFENERELWLIGERTSEVWFNAGGTNFAFSRVPGVGPQIGCAAQNSITRAGPALVWLANNEQGENFVAETQQYSWGRISNHAIEHAISQYPLVSDAIGYAYEDEGHLFYVLTFPTADVTWVYDATESAKVGKACWHQRASWDPNSGYHRHRGNCFMNFQDLRIVGDYQSGQLHQLSRSVYDDAGNVLRAQRRAKHVWNGPGRTRVFHESLQIEFTPGIGLQAGQGSNPQAMLRWSNDGGFTWSQERWRSIGRAGITKNRAKWNQLGQARDRVYELNFSDPVPRDLIGATLWLSPEDA